MSLTFVVIVLLLLLLWSAYYGTGAYPTRGAWAYSPLAVVAGVAVIVLLLWLLGVLRAWP